MRLDYFGCKSVLTPMDANVDLQYELGAVFKDVAQYNRLGGNSSTS